MFRLSLLALILLSLSSVSLPLLSQTYLKANYLLIDHRVPALGLSLGTRSALGPYHALDLSWSLAAARPEKIGYYTSPRIAFLQYLPCQYLPCMGSSSPYVGAAINWSYLADFKSYHWYSGLQGEVLLGIELLREFLLSSFLETSLTYPLIQANDKLHCKAPPFTLSFSWGLAF